MKHILFLSLLLIICCKKDPILSIYDSGTLPKLEINIDEKYLWSADSGLYIIGSNGIALESCGNITANYNQKWEYRAKIQYKENDIILFDDYVGLRIKGNCSRANSMKSFGLYWRQKYGSSILDYPIFQNNPADFYNRLFVRNSGNDFGRTQIKDISVASIIKNHINFEFQDYKQCVVYLNDNYWGIYNIREMLTRHHFENHFGFPKDNIDLLEGSELNPAADDGTIDGYMNGVVDFLENNSLENEDNYEHISSIIDINSYIDFIIVNTYIGNRDWPNNNVKWWKDRTNSMSKWRWVLFDTDASFQLSWVEEIWIGDLIGDGSRWGDYQNTDGSFYIFNKLIQNSLFKEKFLNRYLYIIEHVFDKHRVQSLILNNKNNISLEYNNFQTKWDLRSKSMWENQISKMIEFNNQRHDIMKKIINKLLNEEN